MALVIKIVMTCPGGPKHREIQIDQAIPSPKRRKDQTLLLMRMIQRIYKQMKAKRVIRAMPMVRVRRIQSVARARKNQIVAVKMEI